MLVAQIQRTQLKDGAWVAWRGELIIFLNPRLAPHATQSVMYVLNGPCCSWLFLDGSRRLAECRCSLRLHGVSGSVCSQRVCDAGACVCVGVSPEACGVHT